MVRVVVLKLPDGMASSLAITLDVLTTANSLCRRAGRREPFDVRPLSVARAAAERFDAGDIVIVPRLGTASEAELIPRLESQAVRRAARLVSAARSGRQDFGHQDFPNLREIIGGCIADAVPDQTAL